MKMPMKTRTLFAWLTRDCKCGDTLLLIKVHDHLTLQNQRTKEAYYIGDKDLELIKGKVENDRKGK